VGRSKRPQQEAEGGGSKNINFRCPGDVFARLGATAKALGLDVSNLVRMLIIENLGRYEDRIREIESKNPDRK